MSSSSSSSSSSLVTGPTKWLKEMKWNNSALQELPIDKETKNVPRQVPNACFSMVKPTPVVKPTLIAYSKDVFKSILKIPLPTEFENESEKTEYENELATYFGGNGIIPGSEPAAHCYCGFQFGHFAGQLGDGRAMYLGEVNGFELQLKGAGVTPYSRTADGRAVLRSSIREFLCSEFMNALNIPTTRAGTLIVAESKVIRDRNYDGNAAEEPMAIVLRLSPSFLRFGSFQICVQSEDRTGPSIHKDNEMLKPLLNYVIKHHFSHLINKNDDDDTQYKNYFKELVQKTAKTVALWQCVGFCHGVLNTDNLSAIGVTIDYGPFGFMERFDPNFVCNSSDNDARYSYKAQPEICKWNLTKLAEALSNIVDRKVLMKFIDEEFDKEFKNVYNNQMRYKLGLLFKHNDEIYGSKSIDDKEDSKLIQSLFETMRKTIADMTNTFRMLSKLNIWDENNVDVMIDELFESSGSLLDKAAQYKPSIDDDTLRSYVHLAQQNPMQLFYVGKSPQWLMQQIEKRNKYQEIMNEGLDKREQKQLWKNWIESYQQILQKRFESLKEDEISSRLSSMNKHNPKYILRNWIAEEAIRAAEDNQDYSLTNELLEIFTNPFESHGEQYEKYCNVVKANECDSLAVS